MSSGLRSLCRAARSAPRYTRASSTGATGAQSHKGASPPDPARTRVQAKIARIDAARPFAPELVDTFQRRHNYLRISLTERCNLRCFYCMPSDGVPLSPRAHILTDDEVVRLATLFVKSGVTKIRLTGGEPTIRKGIVDIVGRLNKLRPYGLKSIGMTSNGLVLHRQLPQLIQNGLTYLNLSLDSLDPLKFELMTRRMGHDAVLRTLDMALASPDLESVKLNVVVIKDLNDAEVFDFVEMTKHSRLSVRFIEFMPFTGNKWDSAKMVPSSVLLTRLSSRYPGLVKASDELNDTARSYQIPGYKGSFGFISSMSDHFCGSCNRLRITADGQIKVCLFDAKEVSLRDQMRSGMSDDELLAVIGRAVRGKAEKHAGMEDIDVITNRPMILIGGESAQPAPSRRVDRLTPRRRQLRGVITGMMRPNADRMLSEARMFSTRTASSSQPRLTHIDEATGRPAMVNVSSKEPSKRTATASGRVYIPAIAFELVTEKSTSGTPTEQLSSPELERAKEKARSKGDVLAVAQLAGIMACKRTADLIPLCHPLPLSHISVNLEPLLPGDVPPEKRNIAHVSADVAGMPYILCEATVACEGKTGVEMEALTAVSVGLLTVWDMLKAVAGRDMVISDITVRAKRGGKSGDFVRS